MLIECIPNVSEGRDETIIRAFQNAIAGSAGVRLLHSDVGYDTNRTVFTFVGDYDSILNAVLSMYEVAVKHIDIRKHEGAHPRIGAVDVCPFVPLSGYTIEDAKKLALKVGEAVATKFKIPTFLYEQSAVADYRRRLADIRRGELEDLELRMCEPKWKPDFGPAELNPKFGATVVGARDLLIAFNISLKSQDLSIARTIARKLREKRRNENSLEREKWLGVRALGWMIREYSCVQVSTNIVDTKRVSLFDVFSAVSQFAKELGVEVLGSELIGLVTEEALKRTGTQFGAVAGTEVETAVSQLGLNLHSAFVVKDRVLDRISGFQINSH